MIETFITKYLLDFALVFLVGLASKFMVNKFGQDRADKTVIIYSLELFVMVF